MGHVQAMISRTCSTRRQWLKGVGALASIAAWPGSLAARPASERLAGYPFTLGVASGEPVADGFVIWTRLAPLPLQPDGGMLPQSHETEWEVAHDRGFRRIAARGRVIASPAWGHSVRVEVEGLKADRPYWYRFRAGGEISPVGRARTTPRAGSRTDRMQLCFASCQNYEKGHYAAYRHMVADDPDLILFLGDYIYEGEPGSRDFIRLHQNPEPFDLDGYRIRYATYRSDPLLQTAHAAAPWMAIWDDHEVANDYGGIQPADASDPAAFPRRRAAAYQAYFEHMPLRWSAMPAIGGMPLYRGLDWGDLAQFQLLDNRQYRSLRACESDARGKLIPDCADRSDPARTMLGAEQERWLMDRLSSADGSWNLLVQQTMFGPFRMRSTPEGAADRYSRDGWDGAPATRDRIARRWIDAKVRNPLILGGDIHTFAAGDVQHPEDGSIVASEFVGSSISSLGKSAETDRINRTDNPRLAVFDSSRRGYGRVDLTRDRAEITFRVVANALDVDSPLAPDMRFVVEDRRPGLIRA